MTEEKSTQEEKKEGEKKEEEKDDVKVESVDACRGSDCAGGNNIFIWLIVIVVIIGAVIYFQQKKGGDDGEAKPVSEKVSEEVSAAALELIEGQLVAPGTKVEIKEVTEESGLYKIELIVEDQELTSYLTKDKMKFIPQLIDVKELEEGEDGGEEGQDAPATEVQTKSDKPEVELFVMSHCPYGTQMEKGILPVLDALGNTIDMNWKFVDYAMHGELEVKEQMRQYCVDENAPSYFNRYLECFLAGSDGSEEEAVACMTTLGLNKAVIAQCEKRIDAEYGVLASLEDKDSWVNGQFPQFNVYKEENEKYGVQGSPTLVINGELVQSGRDSASILKVVCSAFNEQPEACTKELSSASPAPGFGTGVDTTGASTDAGCGA